MKCLQMFSNLTLHSKLKQLSRSMPFPLPTSLAPINPPVQILVEGMSCRWVGDKQLGFWALPYYADFILSSCNSCASAQDKN